MISRTLGLTAAAFVLWLAGAAGAQEPPVTATSIPTETTGEATATRPDELAFSGPADMPLMVGSGVTLVAVGVMLSRWALHTARAQARGALLAQWMWSVPADDRRFWSDLRRDLPR